MKDLDLLTRNFLLGEGKSGGLAHNIQNLSEILNNITPKTQKDSRRVEMAKENLREIKRCARRLEEKVKLLEERVNILEESRENE